MMVLLLPSIALGGEVKPYVSVGAGLSFFNANTFDLKEIDIDVEVDSGIKMDLGFRSSAALGAEMKWFRAELEYSYRKAKFDNATLNIPGFNVIDIQGYLKAHALLSNIYFKLYKSAIFSPYIGGGVGYGWQRAKLEKLGGMNLRKTVSVERKKRRLAYQYMVGNTIRLTRHLLFDVEWQKFKLKNISTSEAGFSLRYRF